MESWHGQALGYAMSTALSVRNALPAHVPDKWGEGILFGFSGVDGETVTANRFVGSLGPDRYGVLIHTPTKRVFTARVAIPGRVLCATGDALVVDLEDAELAYVWLNWHSLIGVCPRHVDLALGLMDAEAAVAGDEPVISVGRQSENGTVTLLRRGEHFALCYGDSAQEAIGRCQTGLGADVAATIQKRLGYMDALPTLDDPVAARLLRKSVAVSKVNILAPEGAIRTRWSTPDRIPHRHMWLWDSGFHTLLQNRVDPDLSYELIRSVADRAYTAEAAAAAGHPEWTGKLAHRMDITGTRSLPTQPPILAWAFAENARARGSTDGLLEVIPVLEGYLRWDLIARDSNANGLLEWAVSDNPGGHCDECGLDNSQRFDSVEPLDAPDFSALLANDALALADLCAQVGDEARAQRWRAHAARIGRAIQALLWDEESGFYYDRRLNGELTGIKAVTGFLPLLLPDVPAERVRRCVEMLFSEHFDTTWPVASAARTEPTFSTDMWRGPAWANMNYVVWEGMRRQGEAEAAEYIRGKTLEMVGKYYERYGVLFEYYDSLDKVPPMDCWRKGAPPSGPYLNSERISCIRDYHWTASVVGSFLLQGATASAGAA